MEVVVTPSFQLTNTTRLTPAKLNLLGRPTFSITGTLGTSEITDGSVTAAKVTPGAFFYGDGTLAGGVYTLDLSPNMPPGYVTGAHVYFKASAVNTGAVDINCDSRGQKDLVKFVDTGSTPVFGELAAGDIRAGQIVHAIYDGTRFVVLSRLGLKDVEYVTAGGTNTYSATPAPAYTAYAQLEGMPLIVKFTNANTTNCTINLNGLGAKSIFKNKNSQLIEGDIVAGQISTLVYDGSDFQMQYTPSALYREDESEDDAGALPASGAALRTITCSFTPKTWRVVAVCSDAGGNAGYVQGDEVDLTGFIFHPGTGSDDDEDNYTGSSVAAVYRAGDTLKIAIHDVGSQTGRWEVPHKTTCTMTAVTRNRWTLKAYCYG